jgi:hypothetical protein
MQFMIQVIQAISGVWYYHSLQICSLGHFRVVRALLLAAQGLGFLGAFFEVFVISCLEKLFPTTSV